MGNILTYVTKVGPEIINLLLYYIIDSNKNSIQIHENANEPATEVNNSKNLNNTSNQDNGNSLKNDSFLGKKQKRDDEMQDTPVRNTNNINENENKVNPVVNESIGFKELVPSIENHQMLNNKDPIKKQPDHFELIREKIDFIQQKYFRIKLESTLPGSESLVTKYTCEECFDKVINLPAVKCSNCKSKYWCESCFYRKNTANYCKKCGMNVIIPLQLTLEETNEINKISVKCAYFQKGCQKSIPYALYYDHSINCSIATIKSYLDDNTKYIYLDQYESNKNKRKNLIKQKYVYYNTDNYYSHLRHNNPITMSRNYDLRENYLPFLKDVVPVSEKLAQKYKCILCKFNKRECLPRNEVAKCRYCNGVFCLNCFYERNLASGPNFYGRKIHENCCPECFNFMFIPQNLSPQEMTELKSIKIKCKFNDRGCPFQNYSFEVPLHAVTCEFSKKPEPLPKPSLPNPDKEVNTKTENNKNIDLIRNDQVDEEADTFYLYNKYKLKDVFNIRDAELLETMHTMGLSKLTVDQLKGILMYREIKIGSKLKDDLIEKLKIYLKEKFSKEFIFEKIISKENFGNYKLDELKGIIVLKGYSGSLEKKTKADCVDLLKKLLKLY
jgi:hypothetical protein